MVNLPGGRYGRLVIIPSGLDQKCFDVALPIDDLIETDEFFEFTILPTDMMTVPVEVTKNSTILVIKDSDREWSSRCVRNCCCCVLVSFG